MFNSEDLNEEQLKAATFTGSDILLAAGPGSGKTHTMTSRILYLTDISKVDPASILVITFTKDAAAGMQNRFNSRTDIPLPVAFGTFHSVFYNMIREYRRNSPPQILYDRNKSEIASSVVKKFSAYDKEKGIKSGVSDFLHAVSIYKNTLDSENSCKGTEISTECFSEMFRYYENIRKKSRLMDFDDMVYDCRGLLLHDDYFARKWKNRFSHILIDEFQDINKAQYETVSLLAGTDSEIFAVGDDDQSIYGFRGSDPSILKKFLDDRNAVLMHLDANYRSLAPIVKASVVVINENKNRIPKNPVSKRENTVPALTIMGFEDQISEYHSILNLILSRYDSLAVLFRTNIEMQTFASYLTAKNIRFRIREKTTSIFDHFIMRDILDFMHVIYGRPSEEHLKNIIGKTVGYIDHEYIYGSGGDLNRIIKNIYSCGKISKPGNVIKKLLELKKDIEFMRTLSINNAITYVYKKTGYEKYVLSLSSDENKKEEYRKILDECPKLLSSAESLDEIILIKEKYEKQLKRKGKYQDKNLPDLMTIHASKGLEFDTVIIPDINEGNFPHEKMPDENSVEEERRIFYVAMTRAANNLYLYYQKGKENGKTTPSRFLNPLFKNNMHKT
ncbi:MAG: ATP-dependent helicase [Lachnospiraceae bacterium]|nr:ATP-dependent helicase [Lachnospiraceae bacterium]